MTTPAGGGRGGNAAPSSRSRGGRNRRGRGGRGRNNGGRNNGSGKGRGDNHADHDYDGGNDDGDPSRRSNGRGRNGGGGGRRQRNFSARGGGGGGSGGGGSADVASSNKSPAKTLPPKGNGIKMSEQDVLIAFGPHVRSGDPEAKRIHQEYLSNGWQRDFILNARKFLVDHGSRPQAEPSEVPPPTPARIESESEIAPNNHTRVPNGEEAGQNGKRPNGVMKIYKSTKTAESAYPNVDVTSDPAVIASIQIPASAPSPPMPSPPPGLAAPIPPTGMFGINNNNSSSIPSRPPPGLGAIPPQNPISPSLRGPPPGMPPPMRPQPVAMVEATVGSPVNHNLPAQGIAASHPTPSILPARTPAATIKSAPDATAAPTTAASTQTKPTRVRRTQTRCEEQPGRLFANDVPAAAFNQNPNRETFLTARPRSELTARWILPLTYLRERALRRFEEQKLLHGAPPQNLTIRDALKNLTVGLFRRGATESGSQSSIVSKEILAPEGAEAADAPRGGRPSEDYFFNVDQRADSVFGHVPFYAPRTPGNVLFRLYFDDEPHVTLATGPCVRVVPSDGDVDSVLRFVLTNFKSKKTNGISSMNSLAMVLDSFSPRSSRGKGDGGGGGTFFDAAGRVAWGCICESRKALSHAGHNYVKRKTELEEKIEAESEAERIKDELPDLQSLGVDDVAGTAAESGANNVHNGAALNNEEEKDKGSSETKAKLMSEKYSNERKWREMQIVYASVLKAAVTNKATQFLLKRDILAKLSLEYDLWCPLTEAFAPNPFAAPNGELSALPGDVSAYPNTVTKVHERKCKASRNKMQEQKLGFVPKGRLSLTLAMRRRKTMKRLQGKDSYFLNLSSAMSEIYLEEYAVSDQVWKRREKVRATVEGIVSESAEFPPGTKVAVFGSSANGFGSPNSDLDLCLQVPTSSTNTNGVEAMANLADKLTEAGMKNVDTVRLTARIPILKFNVPYNDGDEGEEILVECDLSLQNPLACLNTSLLHTYSKISPSTCILASIVKRWAKARNINTPSQHTLSSYGYVIMLIHFLTSCDLKKHTHHAACIGSTVVSPILPNLQWVDPIWARNPSAVGGPYREISAKPKNQHSMVRHPTEPNYYINTYFYGSGLDGLTQYCAENHDAADIALGTLLASFFHYFAYDFDYKKYVVSLNTKYNAPPMEREVKAEEDGWSLFRHGLAIEDPFELFYDIAHVVKAVNFQHIRKEFCLAHTKIVDAAAPDGVPLSGREVIDLICEPVASDGENTAAA